MSCLISFACASSSCKERKKELQHELDNAKRGFPSQGGGGAKFTLTFDNVALNQCSSSSRHPQVNLCVKFWKWSYKNWSLYHDHKVSYTEYQSWPQPLNPWPKINRVPLLIIHNLHVKFESDRTKTVVCIVPTRQSKTDGQTHARTDSLTHPLIHPTTDERTHYYIPSNAVARG